MKNFIKVVLVMVLVLGFVGASNATDKSAAAVASQKWTIDNIGIDYQQGKDEWLSDEHQGDHCTNVVDRYSIRLESDSLMPYLLNDSWDKWTLGTEFHYSAHKANEKPDHGQDAGFKEIGVNVIAKRHLFNKLFYTGGLLGVGYALSMPEFENRNWKHGDMNSNIGGPILGSIGILIGKDWYIGRSSWAIRTEGRVTHTSAIFAHDSGKNFAAWVTGLTYSF